MDVLIWIGTVLGAVAGLAHGIYIYRQEAARPFSGPAGNSRLRGAYFGLWTFALWALFGTYVLTFWILGSVGYSISRLVPKRGMS